MPQGAQRALARQASSLSSRPSDPGLVPGSASRDPWPRVRRQGRLCSWIPALALRARPGRHCEIFLPLERVGFQHLAFDLALADETQAELLGNSQRGDIVRMDIGDDAVETECFEP